MTLKEALASSPGFVMDMYILRMRYDDEQHGIKRRNKAEWSED